MERATKNRVSQNPGRLAAARVSSPSTVAKGLDNRLASATRRQLADAVHQSPKIKAQRATIASIHNSPYAVAQKRHLGEMFGEAVPLNALPRAEDRSPAQRMVAIATDDMAGVTDALILNNMDYALGHFGGPVGDFKNNRKFGETKAGDRVAIVAHGSPGEIGGYTAPKVADVLTRKPGPIHKDVSSVVLYSCNAGMDQDKGPDSSLVHGLSAALKEKDYEIGVEGLKGIGFGFKGIGERTTKGTEAEGDRNWFSTRDKMFKKPQYAAWEVAPGRGFVAADKLLEVGGGLSPKEISTMSMEAKAKAIGDIMAPFWREVEQAMGSTLYDHLKGWVRVKTYLDGGQLVQDTR